jgi:uncharacterized protein YjbI with pentapeptide repeats
MALSAQSKYGRVRWLATRSHVGLSPASLHRYNRTVGSIRGHHVVAQRITWLGVAVAVLGLAGVLSLWLVPEWLSRAYTGTNHVTAMNNARTTSVAFLVIVGSAVTIVYTVRTYVLSREGQITDRYSKAVEHLGDDRLDVRLGCIYALERIARDSRRDHATIIEILSAYVRERRKHGEPGPLPEPGAQLPTDVQAALTVLGRLPERPEMPPVDLRFTNLDSADLSNARLPGALLSYALLRVANLEGAILTGADLRRVDLTSSMLTGCNLRRAKLEAAILNKVNANGATFEDANLRHSKLYMTTLAKASLRKADMTSCELRGPDYHEIFLGQGRMIWKEAQMSEADLTAAKLPVRLRDLDLRHVVGLTQHQLDNVWISRVLLPDGLCARPTVKAKETTEADVEGSPIHNDPT